MRFNPSKILHAYYLVAMIAIATLFAFGVSHYYKSGILNIDFVSSVYDGTNKVKIVKDRADLDEIKKFVDGDRLKDALKVINKLEQDIKDLRLIKSTKDQDQFDENFNLLKQNVTQLQNATELSTLLTSIVTKISTFEAFVTQNKWPTLTRMSVNLRNKASQAKIISNGVYHSERVHNLLSSINNDLEAMTNFVESSGLKPDIKTAIIARMKGIRSESENLKNYVEERKKFLNAYKNFQTDFSNWFKLVEPEIAFKKIDFEKSSQTIIYSIMAFSFILLSLIVVGGVTSSYVLKMQKEHLENSILTSIKEDLIPAERKNKNNWSHQLNDEISKYHDHIHRRMNFGTIFQEAMPLPTILLDNNLNLTWANLPFYQAWKLENFKDDSDTLSWDFLQRFTNLEDHTSLLNALRMNHSGTYTIMVKTASMDEALPYEMYISPIEHLGQKRILIIFYPSKELQEKLILQRGAIVDHMSQLNLAFKDVNVDVDQVIQLEKVSEMLGIQTYFNDTHELLLHKNQEIEKRDLEITKLEDKNRDLHNLISSMRLNIVESFEQNSSSMNEFNRFKNLVLNLIDSRDQVEEQVKFVMNASKEMHKDQAKILHLADAAECSVDEYIKSLKNMTELKGQFKDLRGSVQDFKSRIVQVLDQLLIFQNHEGDSLKIDQFLGKIKIEMKGFEKILFDFNQVITTMDVTITKIDLMANDRVRVDTKDALSRMELIKSNIDNVQFSLNKVIQVAHAKDDDLINSLKVLVTNLKVEMKRVDEMCKLSGITEEHLSMLSNHKTRSMESQI